MSRVGFIGAGRMGAPMVGRLAEAGHEVRALGRTAEKCAALEQLGAQPVATVEAVADGADVVIVCVFTDEQVQQVCMKSDLFAAMKPGAALVIHTTGSPGTAEAVAARAEPTLLQALPHGSGSSRALSGIAAAGSVATFIKAVGDFIGKDVAMIRETVAELGIDMGALDNVVNSGLPS
jgi:3-hydroxyisobutyrate dehydrogenase